MIWPYNQKSEEISVASVEQCCASAVVGHANIIQNREALVYSKESCWLHLSRTTHNWLNDHNIRVTILT